MKTTIHIGHLTYSFFSGKRAAFLWVAFALFSMHLPAQNLVYVGGTLHGDRFWSSDSIYVVYQDLKVADSATLTIEPGTAVKVVQGRGILINGILKSGSPDSPHDTIIFMANSQKGTAAWRWKGITFQNCVHSDTSYVMYTLIKDAETAIALNNCKNIGVHNCKITGNQNNGVTLFNSSGCQIIDCDIINNYTGIEINASLLHKSSDNIIENNFFQNENYNIYMYRQMGGIMNNNIVTNNLLQYSNNGLWIDNEGDAGVEKNLVEKNIFIGNGGNAGYALFISNDSTYVINNIFWENNIAIFCEQNISDVNILKNSFYENNIGIILGRQSFGYLINENTFANQKTNTITFRELTINQFMHNNIFCPDTLDKQVVNETDEGGIIDNNFWNTRSDSLIEQFIWDKNDNPVLGTLIYFPFLEIPDTVAPPAPPFDVKQQLVNNKIRITWHKGSEPDLKGYKLYRGNFNRYHFDSALFIGNDTVFFIEDNHLNTIALTSVDHADTVVKPQLSAHESPFAFAKLYPYAGDDKIICKFHDSVTLNKASIPYSYENFEWTTQGDGTFNNNRLIHPVYYPGNNDKNSGKVVISLSVLGIDEDRLTDSLTLYIFDNPIAHAGSDKIIALNDTLFLNDAFAENYQSVRWYSSGDGFFGNDSLINTFYIAGNEDKNSGYVTLTLFCYSLCGFAADTLEINFLPDFSLEGSVKLNGENFDDHSTLLAINTDYSSFRFENITFPNPNGTFLFQKILQGNYYLYAVPDTALHSAFPTYYANDLYWTSAYLLPIESITKDVDIQLLPNKAWFPDGKGSIAGHFDFPDDYNKFSSFFYHWFNERGKPITTKNGMPNVTLLLVSPVNGEPLRYTLTDENGDFLFSRLPFGTYDLKVELAGFQVQQQLITVTPEHKDITGVTISLSQKSIRISNIPENKITEHLKAYPMPATDRLTLIGFNEMETGIYCYAFYNLHGHKVLSGKFSIAKNQHASTLRGLDKLLRGIYLLKISGKKTNTNLKILIN